MYAFGAGVVVVVVVAVLGLVVVGVGVVVVGSDVDAAGDCFFVVVCPVAFEVMW